jgi:hypothetical protein
MRFAIPTLRQELIADAMLTSNAQPCPAAVWGMATTVGSHVAATAWNHDVVLVTSGGGR